MFIIAAVASAAGMGQADRVAHRFAMTGLAAESFMGAIQGVIGLRRVIETPEGPAVRVVTQPAFRSEPLFVGITFFVTLGTFERGSLEGGGEMAFFAGHDRMLADKRELRQIMVKEYFFGPAAGIVTAFALVAQASLVNVVALVAPVAGHAQLVFDDGTLVACFARKLGVAIAKRKARVLVVVEA